MRQAIVLVHNQEAGVLEEIEKGKVYRFIYNQGYSGPPVSLTMPVNKREYQFQTFPPFFEGLLPEGLQLEGLLKQSKIDRYDFFQQLITVGADLVGAVTVKGNKL